MTVSRKLKNQSEATVPQLVYELESADLESGMCLHVKYDPDRDLTLTYLGDDRFIVNEAINSKLRRGDEILVEMLAIDQEIVASDVFRNGVNLGEYRAAKYGGLRLLEILL